jgi:serine/threonine protein kinase
MSEVPSSDFSQTEVLPSKVPPWTKYKIRKMIGQGNCAIVNLANCTNPDSSVEKVSIKIMKPKLENIGLREADIMSKIPQHPLICAFKETFYDPFGRMIIVMEFCEGMNLQTYLKAQGKIDPRKIIQIMLQISSAIAHLHEHQIFHGDIKPANIMIDEKDDGSIHIKLIDFGISAHFDDILQLKQGSPLYFSPEIAHQLNISSSSDIWAFAVMLLQMLSDDDKPFFLKSAKSSDDIVSTLKSLSFDSTPFPENLLYHEDPNVVFLARVVQRCLSLDSSDRPRAQEIVEELTGRIAELGDA